MDEFIQKRSHFNTTMLIVSIIASVIFWFAGEIIYNTIIRGKSTIVGIGIYFLVFAIILFAGLFLGNCIKGTSINGRGIVVALASAFVLMAFGMLFEFLYELGSNEEIKVDGNYIFLIDNSGSMEENDPMGQRVSAIQKIIAQKDESFEYAVYSFGAEVSRVRDMLPKSAGIEDYSVQPYGPTPIIGTLKMIQNDIENGELPGNEGSQVILITDGFATDTTFLGNEERKVIKFFQKEKIPVSSVGIGQVDEKLLNKFADKTGGLSLTIDTVDQISTAMESVIVEREVDSTIISQRKGESPAWRYVLLRLIFVTVLGAMFIGVKYSVVNNVESISILMIVSIIGSLLASVFLEVGLNLLGAPGGLVRLLSDILIGITPAFWIETISYGGGYGSSDSFDDYGQNFSSGMRI